MPTAARAVLRPSRLLLRRAPFRNASSATEVASSGAAKAKETASKATSKASEGLSKVTSSAGSSLSKASEAAASAASGVTGRVSRLVSFVQSFTPTTVYYSKVGWEMSKIVFQGQKMAPPSGAQLQSYYQAVINAVRNPSSLVSQNPGLLNPQQLLNRVRNMNSQEMWTVGIVTAQVLGFFTVGEMIGKMKIVGYRGKVEHDEH